VLVAPEPDHQEAHEDDELYVVLAGSGVLTVESETIPVEEGKAAFVPAGADHRFYRLRGSERPRDLRRSQLASASRTATSGAGRHRRDRGDQWRWWMWLSLSARKKSAAIPANQIAITPAIISASVGETIGI
jgi:Cupin domain